MIALIWCPFPDRDCARRIASQLLDEGLIGCANLIEGVESLFAWEGQRDCAVETGALMKTSPALLDAAIERLGALHPYDTPAIAGWHCDAARPATQAWLSGLGAVGRT